MSKIVNETAEKIKKIIYTAISKAIDEKLLLKGEISQFIVEIPADNAHGNFSSNVAMTCAKNFKIAPRNLAQIVIDKMDLNGAAIAKAEVAGPGFINFFLSEAFFAEVVNDILTSEEDYGKSDYGENKKVMVEFVSANPTGPMHIGNARGGALGDCLASVLEAAGFDVFREFYINDAGNQIDKFALSLDVRYQQIFKGEDTVPLPEDSYHGEDIAALARDFADSYGEGFLEKSESERRKALVEFALPRNIKKMQVDLEKYRITYDNWFHESDLHKDGEVDDIIELFKARGLTYEKEGALWYKATELGLEKDEVLVRKNGTPTYFASDIAYHYNKFVKRKFDLCIDLLGADHHGHVARLKKTMRAIGIDEERLDILLFQLVRLIQDGKVVKMSKRTGKAIQLADLLDEVPIDSVRFIFNMREANSQMDFDLDLAKKRDSQNPVYYVQYAHARICSILKLYKEKYASCKWQVPPEFFKVAMPVEKDLIWQLSLYTSEIIASAKNYDPARITRYVVDLAALFHKFYNSCKILCEDEALMVPRVLLCKCTKIVIKNVLDMFKISSPEEM
ncbi:MAG: arginine--tRNA ligase [Clostridia bacterium]|nr:arginine--tRNA ligase [Clostridia bacterium]